MSRAEEFIKAKTRIGSNTTKGWRRNGVSIPSYSLPWLTPDQARKAVEIAREEIIENLWHDASEKPEYKEIIAIESQTYYVVYGIYDDSLGIIKHRGYEVCTLEDITKWAYVEDLIPDTLQKGK